MGLACYCSVQGLGLPLAVIYFHNASRNLPIEGCLVDKR